MRPHQRETTLKTVTPIHVIAIVLVLIGALNWGLVGIADFNLVSAMFGEGTWLTNLIYILVGLAAIVLIVTEILVWRTTTRARPAVQG